MKQLSVIIPTYNRLGHLKRVLTALEQQSYARECFEVVVVSDGSTDGTHTYLDTLSTPLDLQVVVQPNRGVAAARNQGVARAHGEIVLFLDDDVVPASTLIAEHIQTHASQTHAVVVLGPMLSPPDFAMTPWVRYEQAMLYKQYRAMQAGDWQPTARQFYTGNASVARQLIIDIGGFDEHFKRAEDVELAYRLAARGVRFVFNAAALGYHYAERSLESWLAIPYAYGRNDIIFARDKGQTWLYSAIPREFDQRHLFIKQLVGLCSKQPQLHTPVMLLLKLIVRMGQVLGSERLMQMAYSSMFNLRYYQGLAEESAGPLFFLAEVPQSYV